MSGLRAVPVLALLIFVKASTAQLGSSCITPNDERARCKSIYTCSVLYDVISTRDAEQLRFLRQSQCGYNRQTPLVCCGSADNYTPKQQSQRQTFTTLADSSWDDWGSDDRPSTSSNRRQTLGASSSLPDRSTCGFQVGDRIFGGQKTGLSEFPWMALLQYRKANGKLVFSCGGTLISPQYVLTAGHCVKGSILTVVGQLHRARLGEYNTNSAVDCDGPEGYQLCNERPVDAEIDEIIAHPNYDPSETDRQNDIALVRLKRPVKTSDYIRPICVPSLSDESRAGEGLVVAGWGRTETANSSPIKLKTQLTLADQNQCIQKYRPARVNLSSKQLCAGGRSGKDSCTGDSGGPLMRTFRNDSSQWYIEGIVSFGNNYCGSEGWPGVYTRVSSYADWIVSNAK